MRVINQYLENSHKCTDIKARDQNDGTAYFFRAYFYFNKVRRYGDVPYYDQVLASDDKEALHKPRDSREYVMGRVMDDFDRAIDLLPDTKDVARVTKWSALAFKARAALYEGTFRKYHGLENPEKYLTLAAEAAEVFIDNSGYTLYSEGNEPYRDLFCSDKAKREEVVLAKIYNFSGLNLSHSIPQNITNLRQGFTNRFVNHYLTKDGNFFSSVPGYANMEYVDEVKNRDPRLAQTILCPGYIQKGQIKVSPNKLNSMTGYQPIKFVAEVEHDGASKATSDFPLMRAAEVYLIFAEAKAELGTLSQGDLDKSVNKIRKRAKMKDLILTEANANIDPLMIEYYPNVNTGSNKGVILEIRRERTIELVMEGERMWDMFRWKEGAQMVNEIKPYLGIKLAVGLYDMDGDGINDLEIYETDPVSNAPTKLKVGDRLDIDENSGRMLACKTIISTWNEARDYLWPIPADQRVLTQGALTQNPGYEDGLEF